MSVYAVGDVQGCYQQVRTLVEHLRTVSTNPTIIFVGDLVNRGPQSLDTMRYLCGLGSQAKVLLGNHDLHLLAIAAGSRTLRQSDTIGEILDAPDKADLLDWLRQQPLAKSEHGHLLIHAGVVPQWTVQQTLGLAQEVSAVLRGPRWIAFLRQMYGDTPARWDDALRGIDRLRCIVNALTRIRFCREDGTMEFTSADSGAAAPSGYMPWFDVPGRRTADATVVFGHWSTLGLTLRNNLIGLDTGCVWGGKLTAVRLDDREIFQFDCPQYRRANTE